MTSEDTEMNAINARGRLRHPMCHAIIGIVVAFVLGQWLATGTGWPPAAVAQIPDTGLQRKQIIDEQRRTNELLEQILDVLQNRTIKVQMSASEKERGAGVRSGER
jgi:hypothetical protein